LDRIPKFGVGDKSWILISVYHEWSYVTDVMSGNNDNDITAIIFADDRQSAIQQLYNHPIVIKAIYDTKEEYGKDYSEEYGKDYGEGYNEVYSGGHSERDILSLVFGDELVHLAQLGGDFIEVSNNIMNNITPSTSSVEFLMTYPNYMEPNDIKL